MEQLQSAKYLGDSILRRTTQSNGILPHELAHGSRTRAGAMAIVIPSTGIESSRDDGMGVYAKSCSVQ
jgi:hypothetical protein